MTDQNTLLRILTISSYNNKNYQRNIRPRSYILIGWFEHTLLELQPDETASITAIPHDYGTLIRIKDIIKNQYLDVTYDIFEDNISKLKYPIPNQIYLPVPLGPKGGRGYKLNLLSSSYIYDNSIGYDTSKAEIVISSHPYKGKALDYAFSNLTSVINTNVVSVYI